jgi:hypothetical protein
MAPKKRVAPPPAATTESPVDAATASSPVLDSTAELVRRGTTLLSRGWRDDLTRTLISLLFLAQAALVAKHVAERLRSKTPAAIAKLGELSSALQSPLDSETLCVNLALPFLNGILGTIAF